MGASIGAPFSLSYYDKSRKEVIYMTFPQSIMVALICMSVVFMVLIALWGLIRLFSLIVNIFEKKKNSLSDSSN